MENFKRLKIKIFKGVINPIAFLILFGLFFSTPAHAATLSVTWETAIIPGGNNNFGESGNPGIPFLCRSSSNGELLQKDRTEEPRDVAFSEDGLTVFTANGDASQADLGGNHISQNRIDRPFDVSSDRVRKNPNANCDDVDGLDTNEASGAALNGSVESIDVVDDGKIFFVLDGFGQLGKFNAATPNDVDGVVYERKISFGSHITSGTEIHSVAFSRDGTKLYALNYHNTATTLTTFSLPGRFDISSFTQIHQVDYFDLGVLDDEDVVERAHGIEFSSDGSAMFLLIGNKGEGGSEDTTKNYIYQFSLSKNFDVSTATKVGRFQLGAGTFLNRADDQSGMPRGFTFSSDGMRLFIVEMKNQTGVDQINQFRLECPFGIVQCTSDSLATTGAQVELAKQNIIQNVSVIFKRFEWIKRNRDQEDLSSHNINLNYPNPILEALAMKLEPTTKRTIAKFVSTSQKKEKKSKWSSWSLGDISIGDYDKHGFEKQKKIKTKGLIFGADRRLGQNKFLGWALRYGNSSSNIRSSAQGSDMESFTLNIYGTIPRDDYRYINVVLGLSALSFDNKYTGKLSGERNGKQAFTSINYRTRNTYGILNITPTLKLDYGVTRLSEYTDFISTTIDGPATDIRYAEDTFKSGEFATGFLFETEKIDIDLGTFQPMGSIEYIYDLTPDIDYKYTLQGETIVNKDRILGKYSEASLKTNIGFELIYLNGLTLSPSYERIFSLSHDNDSRKFFSERFLVKISRSKQDDSQFALNIEPITGSNEGSLSFVKNINGFDFKINSNYKLKNNIDYLTNFEISGKF